MSTFLSGVSVFLSTVALICGGYAAYEVVTLRQTLNNTVNTNTGANTATTPISSEKSIPPEPNASPEKTTPTPTTTPALQPGQFVQTAFGNKAKVELLSAKRIKDPETANRDVVNVQMRIRRQATDGVGDGDTIAIANTTARNPDTSETYKGISANRSTGNVSLSQLRPNASADAYVWIRVPDGVNTLDIFVPDTGAFKNVPISN
ncbi:hypothetical protein [Calothrix sp. PCC 7507]|uniref:hypothetical protein n=1 Tax=Calothrix sp. PCC 7507 TaxID=99598 RepID=UPI00029F43C2|nr:hypothetical protein [Calothrix sp. PCC 7507]AFY32458.1 hypothetical protein Cal7507_2014 [Calothrix sp. PCC 7507]